VSYFDEDLSSKEIVWKIDYYVNEFNHKPEDFIFISPTIKNNLPINWLLTTVQTYWESKLGCNWLYVFKHESSEYKWINLNESNQHTWFLSIHAAKGITCKVVFLINLSEQTLRLFRTEPNDLIYESLLHVAITR